MNETDMNRKLRAGLAVYGSALNRWELHNFLKDAGLPVSLSYSPGSRKYAVKFTAEGLEDIEIVGIRPQLAPEELWAEKNETGSEGLDIAIMGSDIAMEGEKAGYPVKMLGAMGLGNVDIVMAVQEDLGVSSIGELLRKRREMGIPTICGTQYYRFLAAETIAEDPAYKELYPNTKPQISIGGSLINPVEYNNSMVVVKYSEEKTEMMGVSKFAQVIVDNTQSGETLRLNNYKILQKLGESWYRLYAGPHITEAKEPKKWKKAKLVRRLLGGKAIGLKYTYVIFDFPAEKKDGIKRYLESEGLYTVEPFFLAGERNGKYETKILIPRKKIAAVEEGLEELGAKAITRIPVESVTGLGLTDTELDNLIETKI